MKLFKKRAFTLWSVVCFGALFVFGGCSSQSPFSSAPVAPMEFEEMQPVVNNVGNFEDIELPIELKWNPEKSMAIRTESFKGGILVYSGRVEVDSLKDFIITSMENKKWKLAGEVQYRPFFSLLSMAGKPGLRDGGVAPTRRMTPNSR